MKTYQKIISYVLVGAASVSLFGCDINKNDLEAKANSTVLVKWGLPSDCCASHTDGEIINALTQAQDCHAGHFLKGSYTIQLPKGQLPTKGDYQRVTEKR